MRANILIRIEEEIDFNADDPTEKIAECIAEAMEVVEYDYGQLDPIPTNYHGNINIRTGGQPRLVGTLEITVK